MRLIDADKLPIDIEYEDVESAPTVDAVQVVRCGECRKCATEECNFFAHDDLGMAGPDWYFFCADGERSEE